jgi:uncharacterized protein (DUF4213/DUF364 family)
MRPFPDTLPESAAPEILSGADWTFLTASAIANQTLPRLLALAQGSRIVLMGPRAAASASSIEPFAIDCSS